MINLNTFVPSTFEQAAIKARLEALKAETVRLRQRLAAIPQIAEELVRLLDQLAEMSPEPTAPEEVTAPEEPTDGSP